MFFQPVLFFAFFFVLFAQSIIQEKEMSSVCCPENAHGSLKADYQARGNILTTPEGVEFYSVGEEAIQKSKKAIYLIPDVFGWNSGRTRNIADYFADHDYYVIVPKILTPALNGGTDGDGFADRKDFSPDWIKENWNWESKIYTTVIGLC
jgi:hypothetical protein